MGKKTKFWIAIAVMVVAAGLASWYIVANDLPWSKGVEVTESSK